MVKKISYIMVLSLIINVMIPFVALGQESLDSQLENIILQVKEKFKISDEYDDFSSQISSSNGNTYYYLNWKDSQEILPTINVNSDHNGNIQSYYKYYPMTEQPESKLPTYTKAQALDKAMEFMKVIDEKMIQEMVLDEDNIYTSTWDANYNFRYIRKLNGIMFNDNNVSISVSKSTGEITNYYATWERDLTFPRPTGIISMEEAKKAFQEKIGLELIYKQNYGYPRPYDINGEEIQYYLAYTIRSQYAGIDAVTGEAVSLPYYGPFYEGGGKGEAADLEGTPSPVITPQEREEIEKLKELLTKERAEELGREVLTLDETYILRSINLNQMWKNKGEYQWSMYFIKTLEEEKIWSADVSIDAKSGEVLSFYKSYEFNESDKAVLTKAQALAIAEAYVKEKNPTIYSDLKLKEDEYQKDGDKSFYFTYERFKNDIYVEGDAVLVSVNAVTKEIVSYNKSIYNGILPSIENVIDEAAAYKALYDKIGFSLVYKLFTDYVDNKEIRSIKLIYSVRENRPIIIDANTGEPLDYSGNPYVEKKNFMYIDLDNSYAKDKINTLSEYGIGFYSEEFRPKDKIIQKEFLYFLWKAINPYRNEGEEAIDTIYDELLISKIILDKEVNQTRIVTKEEAVKYVIRAMNYGKIAELNNIFSNMFPDSDLISPNMRGYVNLAYGLGIINGDGSGLIKPLNELRREDAASIIYNFVFK